MAPMVENIPGGPKGPTPARIMVVGEAFGAEESRQGIPFVGQSGQELDRMLAQANFDPTQIRFTNVVNKQPPRNDISEWFCSSKAKARDAGVSELNKKYPKEIILLGLELLEEEIRANEPELIIALGNTALWALTGEWGITKWRGSLMQATAFGLTTTVVPTYHPAAILRQWSWRHIAIHDLRYAFQQIPAPIPEPEWKFILRPSMTEVMGFLDWIIRVANEGKIEIAGDTETRGGQIACIALAISTDTATCIPFLSTAATDGSYWTLDQEAAVVAKLAQVLTHRNVYVIWQNGAYDLQYIANNWRFIANFSDDTMLMQHAAFPGALPKGLDFLASMYCNWRHYWKDEGKEWDKSMPEDRLWRYNCLDAVRTFEVAQVLRPALDKMQVTHVYEHTLSLIEPTLFMMMNGVRIDKHNRTQMANELFFAMSDVQAWINFVLEEEINVKSPKQLQKLFYDQIGLPVIRHRQTGRPTLNEDALQKISDRHPLLSPLTDRILALRSAGVFSGTFLAAPIDPDGRIRCQFNVAGTETGRFSSTKNAFGGGTNLENIPRPRDQESETPILHFPNIRSLFVPDPGYVIADFDLDRADAHIVAWESGDSQLKEMFRRGTDIHLANAYDIWGLDRPPLGELHPADPAYKVHRKGMERQRQFAKNFCHGTNYGGKERAILAAVSQVYGLGQLSLAQVKAAQDQWFDRHPAIADWHTDVELRLMSERKITTIFGRTRHYFDRIDHSIIHQALAYLGQSPVADVINKGLRRVYDELPWCQLLLQNHDSIVVQFPADNAEERVEEVRQRLLIPIPYEDELIIPVGWKMSEVSWGAVRE